MRKVLSLDLGITTGWCVRTVNGELMAYGTLQYNGGPDYEHALTQLILHYLPSYVVAEPPVIDGRGKLQRDLQEVVARTKVVIRQGMTWVDPADWKQRFGKAKLPPQFRGSSTHEKDAYRISEYWLKTTGALL